MPLFFGDPFSGLLKFQQALDSLRTSGWLESGPSGSGSYPPINVFRKGEDFQIAAVEIDAHPDRRVFRNVDLPFLAAIRHIQQPVLLPQSAVAAIGAPADTRSPQGPRDTCLLFSACRKFEPSSCARRVDEARTGHTGIAGGALLE